MMDKVNTVQSTSRGGGGFQGQLKSNVQVLGLNGLSNSVSSDCKQNLTFLGGLVSKLTQ